MFVHCVFSIEDPDSHKCFQVLLNLVDMNLCVLDGKDPSAYDKFIRTTLTGKPFLKLEFINKGLIFWRDTNKQRLLNISTVIAQQIYLILMPMKMKMGDRRTICSV